MIDDGTSMRSETGGRKKKKQTSDSMRAGVAIPQKVTTATKEAARILGIPIRQWDPGVIEDIARTNPGFFDGTAGYKTNCTRCVNAYTMRRLGFDVIATSDHDGSGFSTARAIRMWRDSSGDARAMTPIADGLQELERVVSEWPDEAFGWVKVRMENGNFRNHVFIVEKSIDHGIIFRDPQDGTLDASDRFDSFGPEDAIECVRADDLTPTVEAGQFFTKEG